MNKEPFKLFVRAYVECALWSENGLGDTDASLESQGYEASDISLRSAVAIVGDCRDFWNANEADISFAPEQAGHDFLLTRNRHGAGFWDGGWAQAAGRRLTENANAYGEANFYVGDDGKVYTS